MSASALYRCVAIFELCERLNVVSRWPRITVSHLKLVLSFDEQEQCRLISRANSERWSVQRLQEEAHNAHTVASNGARRGGRSSSPEVVRIARHVEKLVHSSSWVLDRLPHVAQPLDGRYTQVEERIHQAIRCLEEARDVLESLRPNQTSLRSGTERQPAESGVQPAASGLGA